MTSFILRRVVSGVPLVMSFVAATAQESARLSASGLPVAAPTAVRAVTPAAELYCGDTVSEALHNTSPEMPCWADIRSADRWNAASLRFGELLRSPADNGQQTSDYNRASITGGFLQGNSFAGGSNPHVYGGIVAAAVTAGRQRWHFSAEDVAGGSDVLADGASNIAGINRGTLRIKAEVTPRLLFQVRATNTFGTDGFRLYAPLDYRIVGQTEAPFAEAAAYGLHNGRVISGQEEAEARYASSRRTSWDFLVGHSLQNYSDFGTTVQTLHVRGQVLHALTPANALGIFATVATQTSTHTGANLAACSLVGGGVTSESRAGRAILNLSAGIAKATNGCGDSVLPYGDAALTVLLSAKSVVYFTIDRKLSEGVLLTSPLLSTASFGLRHTFAPGAGFNVGAGGLLGSNALTHRESTAVFAEAGVHYRLGKYLMQQTALRRFQNSAVDRAGGGPGGQTVLTFSLWLTRRDSTGRAAN